MNIIINGAGGRMGRMLVTRVIEDPELKLVGALEYSESPFLGQDAGLLAGKPAAKVLITADPDEAIKDADCTVDFSAPGSTIKAVGTLRAVLYPRKENLPLAFANVTLAMSATG